MPHDKTLTEFSRKTPMFDFTHVKIEVFIPEEYVQQMMDALTKINVGRIGNYDHCFASVVVRGHWRPLEGANPFEGKIGEMSEAAETKVEVTTKREYAAGALMAIRSVHPYEEPVINVIPLANHLFEKENMNKQKRNLS